MMKQIRTLFPFHFISSPESRYEKWNLNNWSNPFKHMSSRERLQNILDDCVIKGNPKGAYISTLRMMIEQMDPDDKNEVEEVSKAYDNISSVSFGMYDPNNINGNESTPIEARKSMYSIVFKKDFMYEILPKSIIKSQSNSDIFGDKAYLEDINYGFWWEKEHRHKGNLSFEESDIAFLTKSEWNEGVSKTIPTINLENFISKDKTTLELMNKLYYS